MYTIMKEFAFEGAHSLPSLPSTHKCSRLHGHSYRVRLYLRTDDLDEHGFVKDYGELKEFKCLLESEYDHRNINEVIAPIASSAENLARLLFQQANRFYPGMVGRVRVSESLTSWAEYEK